MKYGYTFIPVLFLMINDLHGKRYVFKQERFHSLHILQGARGGKASKKEDLLGKILKAAHGPPCG